MNTQRWIGLIIWGIMLLISIWFSFGFMAGEKSEAMDTAWIKYIAQAGIVIICLGLPALIGMLAGILSIWINGKMNGTWVTVVSAMSWIALLFFNPWLP